MKKAITIILMCAMLCSLFGVTAFAGGTDHYCSNLTLVPQADPTCSAPGCQAYKVCDDCGLTYTATSGGTKLVAVDVSTLAIPALGHKATNLKHHEEVPATCTEMGCKAYLECEKCGQLFDMGMNKTVMTSLTIDALGHKATDMKYHEEVPATCTEMGYKAYLECEKCGQLFDMDMNKTVMTSLTIDALGHKATDMKYHEEVPATCTEMGYKAYLECEKCGQLFDMDMNKTVMTSLTIDALGHKATDMKYHEEVPATCTEMGYKAYLECEKCGQLFDMDMNKTVMTSLTIDALGHVPGEPVGAVEATETEDGYTGDVYCTVCGELLEEGEVIPALGSTAPVGPAAPGSTTEPKTGDESNAFVWFSMMALSVLAAAGAAFVISRNKYSPRHCKF